jgi:hypothetical protein
VQIIEGVLSSCFTIVEIEHCAPHLFPHRKVTLVLGEVSPTIDGSVYAKQMEFFCLIINLLAELTKLAQTLFTDGMHFIARLVQKLERALSGRFTIVVVEHTAKPFAAMNRIIG